MYANLEEYLACLVNESNTCNAIATDLETESETLAGKTVICFPNPFHDSFTLKTVGAFHYTVYDLSGVEVNKGDGEGSVKLGVDLRNALYVVKVEKAQGTQFLKVTKSE